MKIYNWKKYTGNIKKGKNDSELKRDGNEKEDLMGRIYMLIPILVFFITYIFFSTVLMIGVIPSTSMWPTLQVNDYILSNRLAYMNHYPERGDIISFYNHEEKEIYCKRVIGIAGEVITFEDGKVYINGSKIDESYLESSVITESDKTFCVPKGKVFVLGDNRKDSYDSRYWDDPYVDIKDIKSKEIMIISFHKFIDWVHSIKNILCVV